FWLRHDGNPCLPHNYASIGTASAAKLAGGSLSADCPTGALLQGLRHVEHAASSPLWPAAMTSRPCSRLPQAQPTRRAGGEILVTSANLTTAGGGVWLVLTVSKCLPSGPLFAVGSLESAAPHLSKTCPAYNSTP